MVRVHLSPLILRDTENDHLDGGIAQLGEHLPCKQGVKGSNPFISIRYHKIPNITIKVDLRQRFNLYLENFIQKISS